MTISFSPLFIPLTAWLFALVATYVALSLLAALGVMDTPSARSNHAAPTPRGGGIAFMIPILFFLMSVGVSLPFLLACVLLLVVSFVDDMRSLPVSLRLFAQALAVMFALQFLPGRLLPAAIPYALEWTFIAVVWIWFINLTNFMDGIDGITSMQVILMAAGICFLSPLLPALPDWLPQSAAVIAAATFGFYWFNRAPAQIFMGDSGSIPLGFIMGYLLLCLAISGAWVAALILPAYYLTDATLTLLCRLWRREKIWQSHSQHAYQQAVRRGQSHTQVVRKISLLNLALIGLAMLATVHMITALPALICAYLLTACLIRHFTHASFS